MSKVFKSFNFGKLTLEQRFLWGVGQASTFDQTVDQHTAYLGRMINKGIKVSERQDQETVLKVISEQLDKGTILIEDGICKLLPSARDILTGEEADLIESDFEDYTSINIDSFPDHSYIDDRIIKIIEKGGLSTNFLAGLELCNGQMPRNGANKVLNRIFGKEIGIKNYDNTRESLINRGVIELVENDDNETIFVALTDLGKYAVAIYKDQWLGPYNSSDRMIISNDFSSSRGYERWYQVDGAEDEAIEVDSMISTCIDLARKLGFEGFAVRLENGRDEKNYREMTKSEFEEEKARVEDQLSFLRSEYLAKFRIAK